MEVDETEANFYPRTFMNNSESNFSQSIESKVQSMQLDEGTDIYCQQSELAPTDIIISSGHVVEVTDPKEMNENVKAFLQLEKERDDVAFSRTCLFCKSHFTGNRSSLLEHLTEQHAFFLGQPDNLGLCPQWQKGGDIVTETQTQLANTKFAIYYKIIVYINEFLDVLESMLNRLQCLYCEKTFKDWQVLKEHMRKKMHKRINPNNKTFDKFYMCNYVNHFEAKDAVCQDGDEDIEIEIGPKETYIVCLFCDDKFSDFDEIMSHLKAIHDFDFSYIKKIYKLSFYSQVKLINYIRRMVLIKRCIICETEFKSKEALAQHMTTSRHIKIVPPQSKWDQPEYFFSTLETDYLLCNLQDDDEDEEEDNSAVEIISEDIKLPETSILIDENLRKQLL